MGDYTAGRRGVDGAHRKLTLKQERWIDAYLANGMTSAKQAAIDAGYTEGSAKNIGPKMLRNEFVMDHLGVRARIISGGAGWDKDRVLHNLGEIAENEEANENARVAALRQIGHYTGGFEPKKQVDITGDLQIVRGTPKLSD